MSYFAGTLSHGTTGTKTISVGFQPLGMRITVGSRFNTVDSVNHRSEGFTNGTGQFYHSSYSDTTGSQTISGSNKLVSQWERSGTLTEVLNVTFNSFTATQVKYDVNTANANYQLFIEVWG